MWQKPKLPQKHNTLNKRNRKADGEQKHAFRAFYPVEKDKALEVDEPHAVKNLIHQECTR